MPSDIQKGNVLVQQFAAALGDRHHVLQPDAAPFRQINAGFDGNHHPGPELRGRPIGVTNGKVGTCIITSSYEARSHGIKTGMRVKEALP